MEKLFLLLILLSPGLMSASKYKDWDNINTAPKKLAGTCTENDDHFAVICNNGETITGTFHLPKQTEPHPGNQSCDNLVKALCGYEK